MRRLAVFTAVMLIATMVWGCTAREALALTWEEFENLCRMASAEEVETVLKQEGISANAVSEEGYSLLMVAAAVTPNPEIIRSLVKLGADVNARDKEGKSALMFAAADNTNPEIITALLKAGAGVDARTQKGYTSLMFAAEKNSNPEVIVALLNAAALLNAGADVNAKREDGYTILMAAAANNTNPEVIAVLLNAGADPKVTNRERMRAIDYMEEYNQKLKNTDIYWKLNDVSH